MHFELNFKAGKPAYLQITDQVKHAVASGHLRDGEQLPSIRELAEDLRINRNTVAKAYLQLEHEGVVETQQGRGVFVTDNASPFRRRVRLSMLNDAIDTAIVEAHHFDIARDEFMKLVAQRLEEFEKRRQGK